MTGSRIVLGGAPEGGRPVTLDVGKLVESRLLLQANSGAGKSWALRRLLEQSHGQVQHLVLDIEGEFHTLRERFDYVLAARAGGDTLVDVRAAPLLARRLLELGVSAIADLYELKAHDRVRFVRLFLEALIDAPRALWHPVLVVVDEAHHFCPQKGDVESAAAVIDLMTRGRKRGYCGVLATQRLSKLHKDAAAEANVKLIGRAALDVDLNRAAEELGISGQQEKARIRTLPVGTFFAFGPGLSDQVVDVLVGPVVTTHPRPGQRAAPIPPPREKVQKVLAQLADLPKEAEAEAQTAGELRLELAGLKRQLAATLKAAPPAPAPKEVPVLKDGQVRSLEGLVARLEKVATGVKAAAAVVDTQCNDIRAALAATVRTNGTGPTTHAPAGSRPAPRAPVQSAAPRGGRAAAPASRPAASGLTGPERKILTALAQHGERSVTALALLTGYAAGGGAFRNPLGALRSKEYVEGRASVRATEAGLEALGTWDPLPTGPELLAYWLANLPGPERKLLAEVTRAWPAAIAVPALAEATSYAVGGGAFRNPLGRLRTLKLVSGRAELKAADELFDESRA